MYVPRRAAVVSRLVQLAFLLIIARRPHCCLRALERRPAQAVAVAVRRAEACASMCLRQLVRVSGAVVYLASHAGVNAIEYARLTRSSPKRLARPE